MSNQVCPDIGASHAAAQLATSLRQEGWQGQITMMGDSLYCPTIVHLYQKLFSRR